MTTLGKFEGYALRSVEEEDRQQLKDWISLDRYHANLLDPEFFMGVALDDAGLLSPDPRVTSVALEDKHRTLMYIRLTRASRVHIQFAPPGSRPGSIHVERRQMSNALLKGMAFLEVALARAGAMEWIFDSQSNPLRWMAQNRLGFAASPNEMVRLIPRLGQPEARNNSRHQGPQHDGNDGKGAE